MLLQCAPPIVAQVEVDFLVVYSNLNTFFVRELLCKCPHHHKNISLTLEKCTMCTRPLSHPDACASVPHLSDHERVFAVISLGPIEGSLWRM